MANRGAIGTGECSKLLGEKGRLADAVSPAGQCCTVATAAGIVQSAMEEYWNIGAPQATRSI